jgi:hypothetical protein
VRSVGSDYLLVSLGEHVVGVYSLTTAALVAEISLPLGIAAARPCRVLHLYWFVLTDQHGIATEVLEDGEEVSLGLCWESLLAVAVAEPVGRVMVLKVCDFRHWGPAACVR